MQQNAEANINVAKNIIKLINGDEINTDAHAESAPIKADIKSRLFEVLVRANIAAKWREIRSTVKFIKKYISMYKIFKTGHHSISCC